MHNQQLQMYACLAPHTEAHRMSHSFSHHMLYMIRSLLSRTQRQQPFHKPFDFSADLYPFRAIHTTQMVLCPACHANDSAKSNCQKGIALMLVCPLDGERFDVVLSFGSVDLTTLLMQPATLTAILGPL